LNVLEYGIQLSLAASIELGCPRTPLELRVVAPSEIPLQVKLTVTPGFPELTLWDAASGGKMITKTNWPAGKQPSTLWIEASGAAEVKAIGQLLAAGTEKAKDEKNATTHSVWPRRWCVANGNPGGSHGITTKSSSSTYSFDMIPDQDDLIADLRSALDKAAAQQPHIGLGEQGLFTEEPEMDDIQFSHSGSDKNFRDIATNQCPGKTSHSVWRVEITPVSTPIVWKDNILLPVWNQRIPWDKKLTLKARNEWDRFTKALKIHEEGHKRLFDPYRTECLKLLDVFVKTKFIGEALSLGYGEKYDEDACAKAAEMAEQCFDSSLNALNTKLKNLHEAYDRAQHDYDNLTNKGETQSEDPFTRKTYGKGISTKLDGDIPLLPRPPKPRTSVSKTNPPKAPAKANPSKRKK
ncbi:MAG: hypothetical protein KJS92_09835, partial [Bacteroidetes bacterium]|nr:hypothetical protein [Bacteroidota bacterium]